MGAEVFGFYLYQGYNMTTENINTAQILQNRGQKEDVIGHLREQQFILFRFSLE